MLEPVQISARMRWRRAVVNSRLDPRLTLDCLFAQLPSNKASDLAYRASLKRFVFERGPRLQRLASIAGDNSPALQLDEAEFNDPPLFSHSSAHTLREARVSARWQWICDLAQDRLKVWVWARRADVYQWRPYLESIDREFHRPTLLDVLGRRLFLALSLWASHEASLSSKLMRWVLRRLVAQAANRTAAGILALVIAFLHELAALPAHLDRQVVAFTRRVLASGGQTGLFLPLN